MMLVFGIFTITTPKPSAGYLLRVIICALYFTGLMWVKTVMLVNTLEFYHLSICEVLSCVVFVWILLSSCQHMIQLRYWWKYFGSSVKFLGSLWWTVMIPVFIVVDGKLWSRSEWVFYNFDYFVVYFFVSSNIYSSSAFSLMYSFCASISWV